MNNLSNLVNEKVGQNLINTFSKNAKYGFPCIAICYCAYLVHDLCEQAMKEGKNAHLEINKNEGIVKLDIGNQAVANK